jgi:hypothetical protein
LRETPIVSREGKAGDEVASFSGDGSFDVGYATTRTPPLEHFQNIEKAPRNSPLRGAACF